MGLRLTGQLRKIYIYYNENQLNDTLESIWLVNEQRIALYFDFFHYIIEGIIRLIC